MRFTVTGTDLLFSGSRFLGVITPVHTPDIDSVRARMDAIAALGPQTRIALTPDRSRRRWLYDPSSASDIVQHLPAEIEALDPVRMLETIRSGRGERRPFILYLGRHTIAADVHHGLGDSGLIKYLAATVFADMSTDEALSYLPARPLRAPTLQALRRTFGNRPARTARAVRAMVAFGDDLDAAAYPPSNGRIASPGSSEPIYASGICEIDPEASRELKRWRDLVAPGARSAAIWALLTHRAGAIAGLQFATGTRIAVDGRRYLPPGQLYLGNFALGLQLPISPSDHPKAVSDNLEGIVATGAPLMAMGLFGAAAWTAPRLWQARCQRTPRIDDTSRPIDLVFSDVGQWPEAAIPWVSGEQRCFAGYLDPDSARGMTIMSSASGGFRCLSISYRADAIDRAAVDRMIELLADPVGLLEDSTWA